MAKLRTSRKTSPASSKPKTKKAKTARHGSAVYTTAPTPHGRTKNPHPALRHGEEIALLCEGPKPDIQKPKVRHGMSEPARLYLRVVQITQRLDKGMTLEACDGDGNTYRGKVTHQHGELMVKFRSSAWRSCVWLKNDQEVDQAKELVEDWASRWDVWSAHMDAMDHHKQQAGLLRAKSLGDACDLRALLVAPLEMAS